jgi:hypothetical protein
MTKEMIRLEARDNEILPSRRLDDLTDEQRSRIELLLEEMIMAGAGREGIRNAIKHARDKEIIFGVHSPECQYPIRQSQLS